MLTLLAICIHGYHPYAEDGGIYLTGIKRLLNPQLYPYGTGFVIAHTRFSLFAPLVAGISKLSMLDLMTVVFALHLVSIWLTIFAGFQLAKRCFQEAEACYAAICLLAVSLTIPIAGTSLMLIDPYLSARSISTPCTLFALICALDARQALRAFDKSAYWRSIGLCSLVLLISAVLHPLMAGYAAGCVLLLLSISSRDVRSKITGVTSICLIALVSAAGLYALAPAEVPGYAEVARTRTYWFIENWRWFEQFGLLAPVVILAIFGLRRPSFSSNLNALALTGVTAGIIGIVTAILFAHATSSSLLVARLQPLRIFHTIYLLMILMIGGWLGERRLRRNVMRWIAIFGLIGVTMFGVQRQVFAHSAHLELPWTAPVNQWEQAFVWVRCNTPPSAVFALNADFITAPNEDSQNFRAIAERSSFADFSKDGGIAAIEPHLTEDWLSGERLQRNLDSESDADRIASLHSTKAGWIILSSSAATSFPCDYTNRSVKVCRLPWTSIPSSYQSVTRHDVNSVIPQKDISSTSGSTVYAGR